MGNVMKRAASRALLYGTLCSFALFFPTSYCRAAPATWLKDQQNGCALYVPTMGPGGGQTVEWDGRCRNGLADGPGRAKMAWTSNVRVLSGTWQGGKLFGQGTETQYADGTTLAFRYIGEFRDSMPSGRGAETDWFDSGVEHYVGEYDKGYWHGRGTMTTNGKTVQGVWSRDNCLQEGGNSVYIDQTTGAADADMEFLCKDQN